MLKRKWQIMCMHISDRHTIATIENDAVIAVVDLGGLRVVAPHLSPQEIQTDGCAVSCY